MAQFKITVYGTDPAARGQRKPIHTRTIEANTPQEYAEALAECIAPAKSFPAFAGLSATRLPLKTAAEVKPLKW